MNEEKNTQDINIENQIIKRPFFKKIWYSITKVEKYAELAAEGVGRAIGYVCLLLLIFSILISIGVSININHTTKKGIEFLDENFSEINYQNGILTVKQKENINTGNIIVNTGELTSEQLTQYENSKSNDLEIIWLNDRVIAKYASNSMTYYYKDVLDGFEIKSFNKYQIINFLLHLLNKPYIYIALIIIVTLYTFLVYSLSTIIDILILSIFGILTTRIAKIKMRYRAIFNMSVYAITLSTILRLIYLYIEMFTDFTISHFDLMYTAISFIYLTAAIFIIKSDIIKQQMEIVRMIQIKKEEQENETQEEKEPESEKPEKKDEKKDDKKGEKEDEKVKGDTQGSNA